MIGQEKIISFIDHCELTDLPKSLLLIGEAGSGKHTIVKYISNKFNLDIIELNNDTTAEQLVEYKQFPVDRLYLIDLTTITKAQQNIFLKIIEEPGINMHLILLMTSENLVLETVLNRCYKLHLARYTKEQLKQITNIDNDLAYSVCHTPGQLLNVDLKSLPELYSLCSNIIKRYNVASYNNAMTAALKINWKEEYDKFDLDLFLNTLEFTAYSDFIETNSETSLKIYSKTNEFKIIKAKMEKQPLIEKFVFNFLTNLWEALK